MPNKKEKTLVIIDVFPIGRGVHIDSLSFFTAEKVTVGNVVTVPIRKSKKQALVWRVRNVSEAKTDLKKADFSLKKAENIKPKSILSSTFIEATIDIAKYYATTPGIVIESLTPSLVSDTDEIAEIDFVDKEDKSNTQPEHYVIQTDDEERFAHYKGLVREEFAKKSSIFFCVPTLEDAYSAKEKLQKGIEKYTYVLHSKLTKKKQLEIWNEIIENPHSVLIIATPKFISIPRKNIGIYVIEKESSKNYKQIKKPHIDIRTAILKIADKSGSKTIYGDKFLRIETIWKHKKGELIDLFPLKFRSLSTASTEIISPAKNIDDKEPEFSTLLLPSWEIIKQAKEKSKRVFILCSRKGISPTTVCGHCNVTVECSECNAPVTLHKKNSKENFYLCHRCGHRRDPELKCENCGSWKLVTLGIGTQTIEEEIKKNYPDVKVFRLDKENARTKKQAEKIIEDFYSKPGSVLIGTEMAMRYLGTPIENTIIASIDALFSLPDFRVYERIIHILLDIRNFTEQNIIIQTRNKDIHIFEYGMSGTLLDFYKEDISDRKALAYPPFSKLIKITVTGSKQKIIKDMENIQKQFSDQIFDVFPTFVSNKKKNLSLSAILKVPQEKWPESSIEEKLKELPPFVDVDIEPESIL